MEGTKRNPIGILASIVGMTGLFGSMISLPFVMIFLLLLAFGGIASSSKVPFIPTGPTIGSDVPVPVALIPVYKAAGREFHVKWTVLAAIHERETSFCMGGIGCGVSSTGALGPMQFEPQTWEEYGMLAPGQKAPPNVLNVYDAIYSAARYLNACGFSQDPFGAVYAYNHADWYVEQIFSLSVAIQNEMKKRAQG